MTLTKYAVFIDTPSGPLSALAPELHEFGFRIISLPAPRKALPFLHAFPKLSLVVVNGAVAVNGELFVSAAKLLQPHVPIVWVASSPDDEGPSSGAVPDLVVVEPLDAQTLREHSSKLLREWFYPPKLVADLVGCASRALAAFGTYALAGDPFLKTNQAVAGEINQVIALSGDRIAGRLVVSCTEGYGRALYRRVFPSDADDAAHTRDLLGEIANLALGRFKEFFERHALTVSLGIPARMQIAAPPLLLDDFERPSLCIEFEEPAGRLVFEFCFGTFDPAIGGSEVLTEFLKGSEVTFL